MNKKELWQDSLERLRRAAAANHYHVTVGDIIRCFDGLELTREDVGRIYKYAEEKNIVIDDYRPHDTRKVTVVRKNGSATAAGAMSEGSAQDDDVGEYFADDGISFSEGEDDLSGEEEEYFQDFLTALSFIEPEEEGETDYLLERLVSGDDTCMNRLVELHLQMVLGIARRAVGRGVPLGDLVQEGNLALVSAIDDCRLIGYTPFGEEFRSRLHKRVEEAIDAAVGEQTNFSETAQKLARDANRLLEVTRRLEEELGRSVTLTELSKELGETEEYIKEVMRISQTVMDNAAAKNQIH